MAWHVHDPFPVSALGKYLGAAVLQHHANSQLAVELIAPLALGLAAAAVQDLYDVQRPNLSSSPIALFIAVIAGTGEGKDAAAAPFLRPFLAFQAAADEAYDEQCLAYEVELQAWKVAERVLLGEMEQSIRQDKDLDGVKERLAAHLTERPHSPMSPLIMYDDATVTKIKASLCERWRSGVLVSMEASEILNGRLGAAFPLWNAVWGGAPIFLDRVAEGRRSVHDARFGMVVGIQPVPFRRFMKRRGDEAHDSGFTARYLIAVPPSTKGLRQIGAWQVSTDALEAYAARARELLEAGVESTLAGSNRTVLRFTPAAAEMFAAIYNNLQALMAPGQIYSGISGQAAKAAENVARVAAVLHAVDGLEGDINEDTITRAVTIVQWFADQFLALFAEGGGAPSTEQDAFVVEQSLVRARDCGHAAVLRSDLKYWCPPDLHGTRLDRALRALIANARASIMRHKGKVFVALPSPWDRFHLPPV